jgi:hypothetical protein
MPVQIGQLLGSAFLLVLAIMLTVFAITLVPEPRNALMIMALIFYLFSPVPYALCGIERRAGFDFMGGGSSQQSVLVPISHFLTGMFFTAGPCTALVLYHTGNNSWQSMILSFGSGVLLVAAVVLIIKGNTASNDDDEF